jgi:hypothetical protein
VVVSSPIDKSYKVTDTILQAFTLQHKLLEIFLYLRTAFSAGRHLAEGQWLKEQVNMVKLRY